MQDTYPRNGLAQDVNSLLQEEGVNPVGAALDQERPQWSRPTPFIHKMPQVIGLMAVEQAGQSNNWEGC